MNMKGIAKVLLPLMVVTCLLTGLGCSGSGGLEYKLTDDERAYTISGIGDRSITEVVIPSVYEEKPVIGIDKWAFSRCKSMTRITIPDGVKKIGDSAFYGCNHLADVTIPDSVTHIGESAFSGCASLESIVIPAGVIEIGQSAFSGCKELASILVAEENYVYHSDGNCLIETHKKLLLRGCKDSTIPTDGSVKSIGKSAFFGCTDMTRIVIPSSVTSIGGSAFSGCSDLTSITYLGTTTQWEAISKASDWREDSAIESVYCTNGTIQVQP